jgi:hypothetical protein
MFRKYLANFERNTKDIRPPAFGQNQADHLPLCNTFLKFLSCGANENNFKKHEGDAHNLACFCAGYEGGFFGVKN